MILTVTMNPSVDINYQIEQLHTDNINRVAKVSKTAGGKGINVARVLSLLDEKVVASGILGGTIGNYIEKSLTKQRIENEFMSIEKESRNCIAIIHDDGQQTELLEAGPTLSLKEGEAFITHFKSLLESVEIVTISGSLPKGLSKKFYIKMVELCHLKNKKVVLDVSGESLREVLNSEVKPFSIKPNLDELKELFPNKQLESPHDVFTTLQSTMFEGIELIVISNGKKGAFVKKGNQHYSVSIPTVQAINPVGSGDATVAGLASALKQKQSVEETIKKAMTTGILNAINKKTGYIDLKDYDDIYDEIIVNKINGGD